MDELDLGDLFQLQSTATGSDVGNLRQHLRSGEEKERRESHYDALHPTTVCWESSDDFPAASSSFARPTDARLIRA